MTLAACGGSQPSADDLEWGGDRVVHRAGPGLDVADLTSSNGADRDGRGTAGDFVLRTPSGTLRLKGGVARVVRDRILPALTQPRSRKDLLDALPDLPAAEIDRLIGSLLDAGVLVETYDDPDRIPSWLSPVSSSDREREACSPAAGRAPGRPDRAGGFR